MNNYITKKRVRRVLRNFGEHQIHRIREEVKEELRVEILEEARKRSEAAQERLQRYLEERRETGNL